ncbi:hypothetical protein [Anatilimnocola floriformis]|uniref:hypothetical protein n=1 Tax=Anatilimnocola floriformis TaxID=2948575 RepID=UPI0020C3F26E|nr:hypothetical protein [Anatilimnocola floriformis]
MNRPILLFAAGAVMLISTVAHAQLGKVLREGAEAAGKQVFRKGAAEAAQESAEAAAKGSLQSLARKSIAESTTTIAQKSIGSLGDDAARAAARHADAVVAPLVRSFGDDGAKALAKLSPGNARRMAMLTDELAATGKGAEFMKVLSAKGDVAAEWIWRNKGSLAVGTVAVAFLANPDPFLAQGGEVTSTIVKSATKDVARPLIERTVTEMAVTTRAMGPVLVTGLASLLPVFGLVGAAMFAAGAWAVWHWQLWRFAADVWSSWTK